MESVQYQAQPMAQPQVQPMVQPQVQSQVGLPLTIKDYLKIIIKRKKIILLLAITFVILVVVFLMFAKFGTEVNSLISLAGEKGALGPIIEQKLILEGNDVIGPVILQNFEKQISVGEFKTKYMEVELVKERVDRTKEQVVSFLSLTTKANTQGQAKKINDDLVKRFFEVIEPKYGEQKTINEKIKVLEFEEQGLKSNIALMEQVLFESSQEMENAEEIITKFKTQITGYLNSFKAENIKGKTLNYYPLIHKKILTDIDRFKKQIIEAEEATWYSTYKNDASTQFIKKLNDYEKQLTSQNISEMPVENFVLMQFEMEKAINQFRKDVVGNSTTDEFTGEQAMEQLLDKRKSLSLIKIQKVQLEQDLLLEKNAYSILSSPILSNSFSSSSNAVIKVSKDYDDVYAALEAHGLLTSSEILEPVVLKYSDMSFETFVGRNFNVEKVRVNTNQGNNKILPFVMIELSGRTAEESKQMLDQVLDNFFNYINKNNNQEERIKLIEEKIELKEDEINNVIVDVQLFETDIYGQNLTKLRKMSLFKTKLLLSDYKKRLSDISTEKIELQDELKKQGNYDLISSPLSLQTKGERFSPTKTGFVQIGITIFAGLFLAIFLVIAFETKFPEYQARYAQFLQTQKLSKGQPVQQTSPQQSNLQPQQVIHQQVIPQQAIPPVPNNSVLSKLFTPKSQTQLVSVPPTQPTQQANIQSTPQKTERKPFFQKLFANKTKDVYYVTNDSYNQTVRTQGEGFDELTQLKIDKIKDVKDELDVMNKIKKNLKSI